jgi:hypothetical protein
MLKQKARKPGEDFSFLSFLPNFSEATRPEALSI